jgi:hypothetical protein
MLPDWPEMSTMALGSTRGAAKPSGGPGSTEAYLMA